MPVELTVPEVGESISEVVIGDWLKAEGDQVVEDESVAELESDKATVELPAPVAGRIVKLLKSKGETAGVGEVIAVIEEGDGGSATASAGKQADANSDSGDSTGPAGQQVVANSTTPEPADAPEPDREAAEPPSGGRTGEVIVMPAAARELAERGLKPAEVRATGPGNRLLKEDVLHHKPGRKTESKPLGIDDGKQEHARAEVPANKPLGQREEEVVAMTPMRKTIAERLVTSQQQAALLTTFNEVDMSRVVDLRTRYKETFAERYGIKLGFMSFFIKAAVDALKQFPQVNAEIRGTDIVYKNYFDVSIAVSGGKGLVVPVIRNAERRSFAEIELIVDDFARRAQKNRIDLDELKGGTFTISNGGVFGSMMSTPIINPPQVAVLGLHAIEDRPVVRDGEIVIRPMMYLALTYDHRIIDGRESVTFLKRIKETIEDPGRMLLEI
jgi:2-oxoglutarate dehydrogenase E2 component (dihydrolipoamide succinyltransferase)